MRKLSPLERFDANMNGNISLKELDIAERVLEIELREEKADTQRRMAWVALWSMVIFTCVLFLPIISDSRIASLADLFGLFYISIAGILGAFFGVQAWMSNQDRSYAGSRFDYARYRHKDQQKSDQELEEVEGSG